MKSARLVSITCLFALVAPALAAGPVDHRGHLYGSVETSNGNTYTGLLRWNTEEAYWDDLFNSSKTDLPYLERHGRERDERRRIRIFGIPIGYRWESSSSGRVFIARFGDIREIRPRRGERVELVMKNGEHREIEGGSNDIGATVVVTDQALGKVELDWSKIDRIVFEKTPTDVKPEGYRLYGIVQTRHGEFEGYVQWDLQECRSDDMLDGETDDGEVSIELGKVRSIEKRSRRNSAVELKDGRTLVLGGSNDVDSSMRGIFVEDKRYGRVEISWDAFEKVVFEENGKSGKGYDEYPALARISSSVTAYDDQRYSGELVYDLDESDGWEMLNGAIDGVEYHIPFATIRSVVPERDDTSTVTLKNGTKVVLEEGQDVSESNDGIVVLRSGVEREVYLPWRDVKRVDFE